MKSENGNGAGEKREGCAFENSQLRKRYRSSKARHLPLISLTRSYSIWTGVITGTAKIHASAWKQAFDEFLKKRAGDEPFKPFDEQLDYEDYVDGKSR